MDIKKLDATASKITRSVIEDMKYDTVMQHYRQHDKFLKAFWKYTRAYRSMETLKKMTARNNTKKPSFFKYDGTVGNVYTMRGIMLETMLEAIGELSDCIYYNEMLDYIDGYADEYADYMKKYGGEKEEDD